LRINVQILMKVELLIGVLKHKVKRVSLSSNV